MSIPRGFALTLAAAERAGWTWRASCYQGIHQRGRIVERKRVTEDVPAVMTMVLFQRDTRALFTWWADGSYQAGWHRHPDDPVPAAVPALGLRPLLEGQVLEDPLAGPITWDQIPRWVRPDLGKDEGTAPAHRWAPDIEQRVQAGMDERRAYARSLREGS